MLSNRLDTVKKLIPGKVALAFDIGTDHGLLPIALVKEGVANRVIASDISPGPLQEAKKNVQDHGVQDKISVRLGDGLEVLGESEIPDVIIICGMGGKAITEVLEKYQDKWARHSQLVVQPMNNFKVVRQFILDKGYGLIDEEIIEDRGHFYQIISAGLNGIKYDRLSDVELDIGPLNIEMPTLHTIAYLYARVDRLTQLIGQLNQGKDLDAQQKREILENECRQIKEVLYFASRKTRHH